MYVPELVNFVETSGVLYGRIPSMFGAPPYWDGDFRAWVHDKVSVVARPAHAVYLSIIAVPSTVGGVSFGRPGGLPTVPDLLVGVIDARGQWWWAGGKHGEVFNLHASNIPDIPVAGWPMWFTFGECSDHRALDSIDAAVIDIYEPVRRDVCAKFWNASFEEFVRTAWAPSRLAWCLEYDDEYFLSETIHGEGSDGRHATVHPPNEHRLFLQSKRRRTSDAPCTGR